MREIARGVFLEDIMFGKDELQKSEILSVIELAYKATAEELVSHFNGYLELRMFVVGYNVTAADVVLYSFLADHFVSLSDF